VRRLRARWIGLALALAVSRDGVANPRDASSSTYTRTSAHSQETRMQQIRRIRPLSLGKIQGSVYVFIGLVIGAVFSVLSVVGMGIAASQSHGDFPAFIPMFFGVGAVIILPLMYGIMGFIAGVVIAAIYNFVARVVGGVEIELS
jgi:hypothetical protein